MQMHCGALITDNGIGIWDGCIFGLGEVENTLRWKKPHQIHVAPQIFSYGTLGMVLEVVLSLVPGGTWGGTGGSTGEWYYGW